MSVYSDIKALDHFLSFAPPIMGEEEIAEVTDTLRSGWLTTGPKTERFETALGAYLGSARPVAVNSCTAALHLGLSVLDVGPGQGVITSPLTFASTAHVIMYCRARPYFTDVDPETGNINPSEIRRFLEEECRPDSEGRPRHIANGDLISALLPVHYGGHPAELDELWRIAEDYRLNMLEDAAHAIGSFYRGLPVGHNQLKSGAGELKSLAAFSFYATKNLATGEGGCLASGDESLLERARVMSMYGISDSRRIWGRYAPKGTWVYDVADLGFKYNMMDIQAALGLHQLDKLPSFLSRRSAHAAVYNHILADLEELVILPACRAHVRHAWHLYPLRLKPEALKVGRDEFIEILREHNIGSSVLFIPLHFHSFYKKELKAEEGDYPEAEKFFRNLINLPVAPAHKPEQIAAAAEIIRTLLLKYKK